MLEQMMMKLQGMGEVLMKIPQSFWEQEIGLIFIVGIAIILIIGINKNLSIKQHYNNLTKEFSCSEEIIDEHGNSTGEKFIEDTCLNLIVEDFKKSAQRSTENINTEVIIQKNLDNKIIKSEKIIKTLPSVAIALGLLGTFLGLTLAILETKGVLSTTLGSASDFGQSMEGPFSSMSSAFWTSICGVSSSVILNALNIGSERKKEEFYDLIEDYLDNTIYGMYAKNFTSQFVEFNNIIRTSMLSLTEDMRDLFEKGVNELVSKINKNTIDLTSTAKELTSYSKDLNRLTKSLNTSIDNFKKPVDKFKESISDFISATEDNTVTTKQLLDKFSDNVSVLDKNLKSIEDVIESNKKEIGKIATTLDNSYGILNNSYDNMSKKIDDLSLLEKDKNDKLNNQIQKLNEGYKNLDNCLVEFAADFRTIKDEISRGISDTLKIELNSLTSNIVDRLDNSINKLDQSTSKLNNDTYNIGEIIKKTTELYKVEN